MVPQPGGAATRISDGVALRLLRAALILWLLVPSSMATAERRAFEAVADASVPSTAHGKATRLVVSGRHRSYLKFRISLPAGAKRTRAVLRLYATRAAPGDVLLWRAGNRWSERRLTRSTSPPFARPRLARDRRVRRGWRSLPVGRLGTGTQSFMLSGRGRKPARYHSREGRHAPHLVVRYRVPESTAVACPVARPQVTWRAPASPPLPDAQAAAYVRRSGENHPENVRRNAAAPTKRQLRRFRRARDAAGRTPAQFNPNFAWVTAAAPRYGLRSTDDLIEWAAYKWGIPENFVRAQMVMESGWSMRHRGDRRDWPEPVAHRYPALAVIDADSVWESLGIAQIRWRHTVPWNPGVEPLRWRSTAFALDYSQALVRYYFDGSCDWCGPGYVAGNPDGAYRLYVSGTWNEGQWYADGVRRNAASKPWEPIPPA
jgi:hypothetical protein